MKASEYFDAYYKIDKGLRKIVRREAYKENHGSAGRVNWFDMRDDICIVSVAKWFNRRQHFDTRKFPMSIIQKLIDGEEVTDKDINQIQ